MSEFVFPPALILLFTAALIPFVHGQIRALLVFLGPLLTLWLIWGLGDGLLLTGSFLGYDVAFMVADNARRLFGSVFVIMALFAGLFAVNSARPVELSSAMAYGGGAIALVFAGDLIALFLLWELMVIFSTIVIWSAGTPEARAAGIRYGILQLIAGLTLKVGIEAVSIHTGSTEIRVLALDNFGAWMVLIGILINAAAPPLSVWLSDAYPKASPTGSVFLSLYTTKTAVLFLMLLFAGQEILIWLGLIMIFYGIIYAVRENNIRRLLCYALVNQVGFMLCGIGVGTQEALNAVSIFAVIHVLSIGVLFMTAATVIQRSEREECTALGSLYHSMPLTTACAIAAAIVFTLLPFASGLMPAVAAEQGGVVWLLMLLGCAGVFLHAGLKYVWLTFLYDTPVVRGEDPDGFSALVMAVPAVLALVAVLVPQLLVNYLPYVTEFTPSTAANLWSLLGVLLLAAAIFYALRRVMLRSSSIDRDFDVLYRKWFPHLWRGFEGLLSRSSDRLMLVVNGPLRRLPEGWINYHGPEGPLARTWPTGSMLLWVTVILAVLLIGARML